MATRRIRTRKGQSNEVTGELAETIGAINKRYGASTCRKASTIIQPGRISTGAFILDFALLGGLPENRMSMVIGERHAGKSTCASKLVASTQRKYPDDVCVWIDVEGTYESTWARHLGVNNDQLRVAECETGEMAVDITDAVVRSRETSLVVVDSIAALVPMKEIEDSAEDANVALQARLTAKMIRKISSGLLAERKRGHYVTVLFINQFRNKIGGYGHDNRSVPGGKAVEFATSLQWIIKNKEGKGKSEDEIDSMAYNEHSFTITKNKVNSGPRAGEFRLLRQYDPETGLNIGDIDDADTMLVYAKKFGIYTGAGASQTLRFNNYNQTFRKLSKAVEWVYAEPKHYADLRRFLLQSQAKSLDMPKAFIDTIV